MEEAELLAVLVTMHSIPDTISAGLTLRLRLLLASYPASDGWMAMLIMRGPGVIDITGTADEDWHVFEASAEDTASWAPGRYWYELRVSDGTAVHAAESGHIEVRPDLAAATTGYDGRSHVRRVLDAVEAVLENRASLEQQRYRINDRELWRTPVMELQQLRSRYLAELAREERAASGRPSLLGRRIDVRLT